MFILQVLVYSTTFDTLSNRHAKKLDADCENKLSTSYKTCCITTGLEKAPLLLKKGMKINYECRMTRNLEINWWGSAKKVMVMHIPSMQIQSFIDL